MSMKKTRMRNKIMRMKRLSMKVAISVSLLFRQLQSYLILSTEGRIQNMEEERAIPLRYDLEHGIRMANSDNPVAAG